MASKSTPLMSQYRSIKDRYRDGILFFQVGDFYETFYDDAREVSSLLNITLTTRDRDRENPVPLAGVPIRAAESYISKLLQAGRKVVICDQVEDASGAKGIVKRKVTDVITPGTTLALSTLPEKENNYLVSLFKRGDKCGFSLLDLSTGEFRAGEETVAVVENLISVYPVREYLVPAGADDLKRMLDGQESGGVWEELPLFRFDLSEGGKILRNHFRVDNLSCFGIEETSLAVAAAGAALGHVKELRQNDLDHVTSLNLITPHDSLFLDNETLRNLEVFEPMRGNTPESTLIHHIDRTGTSHGARELRDWIRHPLRNLCGIKERLEGIDVFLSDHISLREIRRKLRRFPDIERLLSRISTGKAGPRELLSLLDSLSRLPGIERVLSGLRAAIVERSAEDIRTKPASKGLIESSIEPACPPHFRDGGVIRKGFDSALDTLIDDSENGKSWISSLQESERKRTGISSLKVGFNKVFGYYIEVSRIHDSKVPSDYICKQTLVSSQRYITKELREHENAILTADAKRIEMEKKIFRDICGKIAEESALLQRIAKAIAALDVLSSLADLALERNFCRPVVNESNDLVITEGRHPVVETISEKDFIPNDVTIRPEECQFLIITGPNMGGKSTYIRQTAIISILAHAGSFVPASRAVVGLMDRVFTRVGASDNLARGQSTFLVEMSETARILHNCTSRSLVILDEIGRGTSTLDGLSIAWAVSEYLLQEKGRRPKTLFATHYHELTHLAGKYPRVRNLRVKVKEWGDTVLFLYRIEPGASDRSYGIHVARLAGLPGKVIKRAGEILETLERAGAQPGPVDIGHFDQPSLFQEPNHLREQLKSLDINKITPLEALRILADLHRTARKE